MTARELDARHDAGGDLSAHLGAVTRPGRIVQKVNVDFPIDLLRRIDAEAERCGVPRQSLIKLHLTAVLDQIEARARDAAWLMDRVADDDHAP